MNKKVFAIVGILVIIATSLGITILVMQPTKEEKTLVVWFTYEGYDKFVEIVKKFNGTEGIYVKTYYYSSKQFVSKFKDAVQAGEAPDIILVKSSWLEDIHTYLYELTSAVTPEKCSIFLPEVLESLKFGGDFLFALPFYMDVIVVVYNRDLLAKANVPEPDFNWTIDDLIEYATKVNTTLDNVWGIASMFCSAWTWVAFQYAYGHGKFVSDPIVVNDTASVKAAELFKNITNVWKIGKDVGKKEFVSIVVNNNTAFAISWDFYIPEFIGKINLGVVPLPIISETGERPRPFADTKGFGIYKGSKHIDEALKFLDFITQPENIIDFCHNLTKVPPLKSEYTESLKSDPIMNALIEQAKYVQEPPKTVVASKALKPCVSDALSKIIYENVDVKEALDEAQEIIDKYLQ